MKKLIYLGTLMVAGLTTVKAENTQPFLSPRAQSQIVKTVPAEKMAKGEKCTSCCADSVALSPRAASQQIHLVTASNDRDLAHRSSTLSPRAQAQLDERQGMPFEVARVK